MTLRAAAVTGAGVNCGCGAGHRSRYHDMLCHARHVVSRMDVSSIDTFEFSCSARIYVWQTDAGRH